MKLLGQLCGALSILASTVASCSGNEFTAGNGDTSAGGTIEGNAGTSTATAGTSGSGTSGSNGSGGANGTGGSNGTAGNQGTGGTNGIGGNGGVGGQRADGGAGTTGGSGMVDAGRDAGHCPSAIPMSGTPCSFEGLSCPFGDCCPSYATCSNSQWQIAIPKCAAPTCPTTAPVNGTSCACFPSLSCSYDKCSITQQMTDAKCNANNVWNVQTYGCENACGGEDCGGGQICLVKNGTKHCVTNPCLPLPLACNCSTLCGTLGCTVSPTASAVMTCQ